VPIAGLTSANSAAELFGVEDGDRVHFGSLEQANGGTLFLENIIDMDLGVQARLLSALKGQSFMRVDGVASVSINVRIIAATTHDPTRAVEDGTLREDLYYHLNVVPLEIPPLRSHRDDIPELLNYYIDQLATTEGLPYRRFTVGAQNRLRNYSWPGNVRELKNVVHRLLILGSGADIDQNEIEISLGEGREKRETDIPSGFDLPLKEAREQFERSYLEHQLRETGGSMSKVAKRVGLERTHLYRKIRALSIDPKRVTASSD
jgi:DNA-binding NtrC family response regulator